MKPRLVMPDNPQLREPEINRDGPEPILIDERFWSKINKDGPMPQYVFKGSDQPCWLWTAKSQCQGYGIFFISKRTWPRFIRAHIYSYIIEFGPVPEGMQVNHKCHNPACVNPAHLYAGTQMQNIHDMLKADRYVIGNRHRGPDAYQAKLTKKDVLRIYAMRSTGAPFRSIAAKYNMDATTIADVIKGKTYKNLDLPYLRVDPL